MSLQESLLYKYVNTYFTHAYIYLQVPESSCPHEPLNFHSKAIPMVTTFAQCSADVEWSIFSKISTMGCQLWL